MRIHVAATLVVALAAPAAVLAQGGAVDFSRYVAVGDSLTAGFQSGGLAQSSQAGSYPRILHELATGNDAFQQPLVTDPGIPAQLRLASLAPLAIVPKPGGGQPANIALPRPYDNLGVPGARVHDTLATSAGGLHDVVLRGVYIPAFAGTTALQQALALNPTFVTLWIGNNDVLAAATSGVAIEGVTLTPLAQFEADYRTIAGALAQGGRKLALATIPRVTAIPFVTTVPTVVVNPATRQPVLVNGQPVPLIGPNGPLSAGDRVLLTAQAEMAQGKGIPPALGGTGQPLSNSVVLSAAELQAIQTRADGYNNVIRTVANERGAALFDAERFFDGVVANGYDLGGVELSAAFLTGGLFSYDGVHPTAMGYAIIADEFVQAINAEYGASIPRVKLGKLLRTGAATTAPVSALQATGAELSERWDANWRWTLGLPSKEKLEKMASQAGEPAGDGGGHGGKQHGEETPQP